MRILIVLGLFLWLMLSWFSNSVGLKAEEITTGNLLTNGNFETGNSNGWTTNGDVQVVGDCCTLNNVPSNYDLEFGDSGSISQDVNLTTNTITQEMLNNGISLTQTTEVQNGECAISGCWGGQGEADTFSINLNIKDSNGNILASMTSNRTDVTNINGKLYIDRLIYTGVNSNIGNTVISGTDANAPARLGGANIDNVSLTMTYDNIVLEEKTKKDLKEFEEQKVKLPKEEPKFIKEFKNPEPKIVKENTPVKVLTAKIVQMVKEEPKKEPKEEKAEEPKEEITEKESNEKETKTVQTEAVQTKKVEEKKKTTKVATLTSKLDKVDEVVTDKLKNLEVKSLLKLDAMLEGEVSLASYTSTEFYKSKDIYLNQDLMLDNRLIYTNVTLDAYILNDPVVIKEQKLNKIKYEKQKLLLEIQELKNG